MKPLGLLLTTMLVILVASSVQAVYVPNLILNVPMQGNGNDISGAGLFTSTPGAGNYITNCYAGNTCFNPTSDSWYNYTGTYNNYTISWWMNYTNVTLQSIFEYNPPAVAAQNLYFTGLTHVFTFFDTSAGAADNVYTGGNNAWVFYTLVCNINSGKEKFYVNGTLQFTGTLHNLCYSMSSPKLDLFSQGGNFPFNGSIFGLSIFNNTQNDSQVLSLFQNGGNPVPTSVNLVTPLNTTYYYDNAVPQVNFSYITTQYATGNCSYVSNNVLKNYTIATANTFYQFPSYSTGGLNSANLTCVNTTSTVTAINYYTVNDTGYNFTVTNAANGTNLSSWTLNASNSTSSVIFSSYTTPINGSAFPVGNDTLNFSATGYAPTVFYSNNTQNNNPLQNITAYLWPYEYFQASNVSATGYLSTFSMVFNNTANTSCSTTTIVCAISLQNIGVGTWAITVVSNGFATQIFNTTFTNASVINQTFALSSAIMNLSAFDEQTLAGLTFNVSITNGTQTNSFTGQTNYLILNASSVPTGNDVFTFNNNSGGYMPRTYFAFFNNNTILNLSAYLVLNSVAKQVGFNIVNQYHVALPGALVSVSAPISGTFVLVAQALAGTDGTASFFLNPSTGYQINASYQGLTNNGNIIFPVNNLYTLVINNPSASNYTIFSNSTTFLLLPYYQLDGTNQAENVTLIVNNTLAQLNWFTLNLSNNATQIFFSNTSNQPSGGSIIATVNVTKWVPGANITAIVQIAQTGFPIYTYIYTYQINTYNNSNGVFTSLYNLSTQGLSPITLAIFAFIITMLLSAWIASGSSTLAGGAAGFVSLGFFTAVGWIPIQLFVVALIVFLTLAALAKGVIR